VSVEIDTELTDFFVRLSLVLVSLKLPVRTMSALRPASLSAWLYDGPRRIELRIFFSVFEKLLCSAKHAPNNSVSNPGITVYTGQVVKHNTWKISAYRWTSQKEVLEH